MIRQLIIRSVLLFLIIGTVAGCNFPSSSEGSSPNDPNIDTAQTLEVVFTQVGSGTDNPADDVISPDTTKINSGSSDVNLDSDCLNRAVFVEDITFRDNTQIESGTTFIKIWRLRNDGTCIWNNTYNLAFIGGERMSAPAKTPLSQVIQPGQTVDLSINMVAPEISGVYQGFWRLQSERGEYFGIGSSGEQSFWIKINVISSLASTPTIMTAPDASPSSIPQPETTPTVTVSPLPTQAIHFQGSASLTTSQSIDLDTGEISPQNGIDLSLTGSTFAESSLVPQNDATFSHISDNSIPPDLTGCQNSPLSVDPISITSLAVDDIICYSTDVGRYGYLRITDLNSIVEFKLTTWGP